MLSHIRNYASAGAITGVVGLVSFPLLTRNLTVAEYGIVGLITASLTLFIAIGKLGFQHSVLRYFSQVKNGNIDYTMRQFNSTVAVIFLVLASITTVVWLLSGLYVLPHVMQYEHLSALFTIAAGMVFVRLVGSGALNILRAQQCSVDVAIAGSIGRCLNLLFIISLLLLTTLNPWVILACMLLAECFAIGYAFYCYSPFFSFSFSAVSGTLAKSMLFYGVPLMILESLELVLGLSDRYMIESMLGASALGQYAASFNLTNYIDTIVLFALFQAIKPAYLNLWEEKGKEKTQEFLSSTLRVYLIVGIPFITLFGLTAPHLLSSLAGEKYEPGTVVIPFLTLTYLMQGAMQILTAGLYIFKDTKALLIWSSIITVVNIALNFILIPKFGIIGAAIVTNMSFAIFTSAVSIMAFRYLNFTLNFRTPLIIAAISLTVFASLHSLNLGNHVVNFFVKGFVGSIILFMAMCVVEPDVRNWIAKRYTVLTSSRASS